MIGRILLLIFGIGFGVMSYKNSDKQLAQQFVVTEKVKTGTSLYLKYKEADKEAIFSASQEQWIYADEGKEFSVYETPTLFYVYIILCCLCFGIFIMSIGGNPFELLEFL